MKIEHVALTISNAEDIQKFYRNILGMDEVRTFLVNKELSSKIFDMDKEVQVTLMEREEVCFELFVSTGQVNQRYNHVCISTNDREELIAKVLQDGYPAIRIQRDPKDLIFIKDSYGNTFEIK